MDSKFNYTIVGLFVLLLGTAMIVTAFWLSSMRHTKDYKTYLVFMNEAVSGLSEQAPVKFNGVQVGYVDKISLNPKNPQQVRLQLEIEDGTPITTSTVATLESQGVTGITNVGLKALTPLAPRLLETKDEAYPVIKSSPSLLVRLDTTLRLVTDNIEKLADSVKETFNPQNQRALAESLQHIAKFTDVLSKNAGQLESSIHSLDTLLKNTAVASKDLPKTMADLQQTLTAARALTKKMGSASDEVSKTMKQSRQVVQNFSSQTMPDAARTLQRLDAVLNNMKQITEKMSQNPAVILRGNLPPPPGPGEE